MRTPERIATLNILKSKMALLEALADIEVAVKVLQAGDQSMNPVDRHYTSLDCGLTPMDKSDDTYAVSLLVLLFCSWCGGSNSLQSTFKKF